MPALTQALQSPQVKAAAKAGKKATELTITPAKAVPEWLPSRRAREMARPPNTTPTSAATGAAKLSKVPSTGTMVSKMPATMSIMAAMPRARDAMGMPYTHSPPSGGQAAASGALARLLLRLASMSESHPPQDAQAAEPADEARAGRCAIVGRANVGKSTLLNALLEQKLVIASAKPGTTRSCILGVYLSQEPLTQIAFVDTPGLQRAKNALGKHMVDQIKTGLTDVEVILVVSDVDTRLEPKAAVARDREVFEQVRPAGKPIVLALNKIDRLKDKGKLLPWLETYVDETAVEAIVPVSAYKGQQLSALIKELRNHLPEGRLYDDEVLSDRPERFFAAEFVREAVLAHTRLEVPHGTTVAIDEFGMTAQRLRISATIIVDKESHKGILIGRRGEKMKAIGIDARQELESFFECPVDLKLWVKVIEGWTRDPGKVRQLLEEISG